MNGATNALVRLAEADGAQFTPSGTGSWRVQDRHGVIIAAGCLSMAEAAILYLEDKGVELAMPELILARIKHEYRPYDTMPEFDEGFADAQANRRHERYDGVKAQAYDRGANAAMLYQRALAHMDATDKVAQVSEGWLVRLLRTGRC